MDLTSISQVRSHLYRLNVGEGEVRGHAVRLISNDYVSLPHAHILSASETVKAIRNRIPFSEMIAIDAEPASLAHQYLVSDTVVCAGDSSLSIVYQENIDYLIDYSAGTVARVDGGAINPGSEVIIWYLYYHVYQRGVDYYFDYERGRLRRMTSGSIEEGQELLVDYHLGSSEFSDSEIEQCISEAGSEILHMIDPEYHESTDPALQTAATCLTLAILCRNSAGIDATGLAGTDKYSPVWMELYRSYRETALNLLRWFRRSTPDMKPPRLA